MVKYILVKTNNIIKKKIINNTTKVLIPLLVMGNLLACKKSENSNQIIVAEPSVISISNEAGNYKRAFDEEILAPEPVEEEVYEYIYDDVNKIYSKEASNSEEIVLRFVGDICFYDGFSLMSAYRDNGENIDNCIDGTLLSLMRGADIFMANNEFCYSDRGAPLPEKTYAFRSKPSNVSILNDMGADIVSLANNHAYDYGPDALFDTVDILNAAKVPFVGAGKNIEEAMRPAFFKINGATISYVSATQIERYGNPDTKEATETEPGVLRTLNPDKACTVIKNAKENSDFCIMYVHWGSENTDLVEQSQRDLAKAYVEAGADLIIGDHSHCLQGVDYIDDVPVFYSMSNYWFNSKTVDTGISEIVLDSSMEKDTETERKNIEIKTVRFIPAIQRGCKTNDVDESEKIRILNYLQGISNYAQIDQNTGIITKSDQNHNVQGGMNTSPTRKIETDETVGVGNAIDINNIE